MKISIINGPNLNLLGTREPNIYGARSFESYLIELSEIFKALDFTYHQSNIEGEIINYLQEADKNVHGIILNAAGYTHTSIAIADAIAAIDVPVIEVHISHPLSREDYRHISIIGTKCKGSVTGFGLYSYKLAIEGLLQMLS